MDLEPAMYNELGLCGLVVGEMSCPWRRDASGPGPAHELQTRREYSLILIVV